MEGLTTVPLSDHEQRILRQIERQFQEQHWFSRSLRVPEEREQAARNAKRAAVGFVLGLVALLISFTSSWVVGLIGFIVMLACAVTLVQSVRRLARDQLSGQGVRSWAGDEPEEGHRHGHAGRWWASRGDGHRPDDEA